MGQLTENAPLDGNRFVEHPQSNLVGLLEMEREALLQRTGYGYDIIPGISRKSITFRRDEGNRGLPINDVQDGRFTALEADCHLSGKDFAVHARQDNALDSFFRQREADTATHVVELEFRGRSVCHRKVDTLPE